MRQRPNPTCLHKNLLRYQPPPRESWKCTVRWFVFGRGEAGYGLTLCVVWWKVVMASITYQARTYFLPVREETQWHTKTMPKRISQSTFMHLETVNKTNLDYRISGLSTQDYSHAGHGSEIISRERKYKCSEWFYKKARLQDLCRLTMRPYISEELLTLGKISMGIPKYLQQARE